MKDNMLRLPERQPEEQMDTLFYGNNVRVERIISWGQSSPDGFWYDQPEDEWVLILSGEAVLNLEGEEHQLRQGDHCMIPAHQRHRVEHTSSAPPCVWLCVFGDLKK